MAHQVSRRGFLAGTAATGIGLSQGGCTQAVPARCAQADRYRDVEPSADVIVLGAGASGIPAAIAAARQGAKVLLLEEDSVPGGAPVDMGVTLLCGWPRVGIFREMVDRLQEHHHLLGRPVRKEEELRDTWFLPTSFQSVLGDMIGAEKNLKLICGAHVTAPIVDHRGSPPRVVGVLAAGSAGDERAYKARAIIDCTGNGAIAEMAGCRALYGRDARSDFNEPHAGDKAESKVMPCTWMYISQRFRTDPACLIDFSKLRSRGANESGYGWYGNDPKAFAERNTGIYLHWGVTVHCPDTRDPLVLARSQQEAYEKLRPDIETLWQQGFAVHLPPRMGVRECRRIMGEHVLTENDMRTGRLPDDTVAIGQYYLDLWGGNLSESDRNVPPFGVPYRSLLPRGVEGLLVAGKIISGSHIAMSAYRVQPIVAQMGQAAGIAAAMAATRKTSLRGIDVEAVRDVLKKSNVPLAPMQG